MGDREFRAWKQQHPGAEREYGELRAFRRRNFSRHRRHRIARGRIDDHRSRFGRVRGNLPE